MPLTHVQKWFRSNPVLGLGARLAHINLPVQITEFKATNKQ